MNAQADAEKFVFSNEWYEKGELDALPALLEGVKTFVDCGASVGPYTKCANEVMSGGRIIPIEAHPGNFAALQSNCATWNSQGRNQIEPTHCAVSDREGDIEMLIPKDESALTATIVAHEALKGAHDRVTVPGRTLDTICAGISPDLIKVDVEGVELRVLRGAQRVIAERKTCFLIEVHPWGDPTIGARSEHIFEFFREAGYGCQRVCRHWLFFPVARLSTMALLHYHGVELVMRHQWLRHLARDVVLLGRKLSGRS